MSIDRTTAGDAIPATCKVIEVRVAELRPSPFRERDLDPRAEEFIVEWSRDVPCDAPVARLVHLERAAGRPDEGVILRKQFTNSSVSGRRTPDDTSVNFSIGAGSACRLAWRPLRRQLRSATHSPHPFRRVAGPPFCGKACSSEVGWPCGDFWRSFSMTGGRFVNRYACPTA